MQSANSIEKAMSDLLMQYIDMERRLRNMHRITDNGAYCNECFQDYPCDTITKGIDNEQDD